MDQAVAGLIGAVIGGVMTGGSSWGLEATRQRRAYERAAQDGERELREASRLIDDELVAGVVTLTQAEHSHRWPRLSERLPMDRWWAYGPIVARSELAEGAWTWLADAYQTVREVNSRIVDADQRGIDVLDSDDRDYLSGVRSTLEEALEVMRAGLPGRLSNPPNHA